MCEGWKNENDNAWQYTDESAWDWDSSQDIRASNTATFAPRMSNRAYGGQGGRASAYGVVHHTDYNGLALAKIFGLALAALGIAAAATAFAVGLIALTTAIVAVGLISLPVAMVWVGTKPLGLTLQYKDRQEQRRHELRMLILQQSFQSQAAMQPPRISVTRPAALPASQPEQRALPAPVEPDLIIFDSEEEAYAYVRRNHDAVRGRSQNW